MTRLVLVEGAPTRFTVAPGDRVISLTPQASYWLDKHRQPYQIPVDFGTEEKLKQYEETYWKEELAWFDELDTILQEHLPELKTWAIRPTILYGLHFKRVVDHLFIRGLETVTLLESQGYDRVVLWSAASPVGSAYEGIARCVAQRGLYARMWQSLCESRGVAYEEMAASGAQFHSVNAGDRQRSRGLTGRVRGALSRCREWEWVVRTLLQPVHHPNRRLTLLFLESNYDLTQLLHRALRAGHRCFVARGQRIVDLSRGGRCVRRVKRPAGEETTSYARWTAVAEELCAPTSSLWRWPNSWFGCSMAPLLGGWLKTWLTMELCAMVPLAEQFHQLYVTEHVDFVLTPALLDRAHVAAVAAGHRAPSTQTVLVAHGSGPDAATSWDLFELFPYHHYFVPTQEFADYFEQRRARYTRPAAQVHVGSYRWQRYPHLSERPGVYLGQEEGKLTVRIKRPPLNLPKTRPIVVYVVGKPEGIGRYMNKPEYSETWYYRLQTALIRLFTETPTHTFIIKLFPMDDPKQSAVGRFTRDLGATHLYVSSSPLSRWLPWAERVIMDLPSTPLYETALARVPFHAVVHRGFTMRASELATFSQSLTIFDRPEEAVRAIRDYLCSPVSFSPPIPAETGDILGTLCEINSGEHDELVVRVETTSASATHTHAGTNV